MKISKIAAGYYSFTYKGVAGHITKVEGLPNWYYTIDDGNAEDWYSTYAVAKLAAMDWIDNYM